MRLFFSRSCELAYAVCLRLLPLSLAAGAPQRPRQPPPQARHALRGLLHLVRQPFALCQPGTDTTLTGVTESP